MITLALDPSLTKPGLAVFQNEQLVRAIRVAIPKEWTSYYEHIGARALAVASKCVEAAQTYCYLLEGVASLDGCAVVYEWPQVYRTARAKGDPNDLIALAAVGAAFAAFVKPSGVETPTPAQWIGQLPKSETGDPWDSPRGQRIKSRLSPVELSRVEAKHDAVDAVGLGLWALGRLERHRVFPGAR